MDELHRLDNTFDSMDEPFGAPRDPFLPRGRAGSRYRGGEGSETASRLSDATVKKLRYTAVFCTAIGFFTAIAGMLGVILPVPRIPVVLPGIPLIIAGAICGSIARRTRPQPVTVTQLIWRIAPSVGAMAGASYSLFLLPESPTDGMTQIWILELIALAGAGALWGSLCALGTWGVLRISSWIAARIGADDGSGHEAWAKDPHPRRAILGGRPDQRLLVASDRNRVVIVPPRRFRARSKRPNRPKPVARERT